MFYQSFLFNGYFIYKCVCQGHWDLFLWFSGQQSAESISARSKSNLCRSSFSRTSLSAFSETFVMWKGMGTYLLNPWVTTAFSSLMKRFMPRTPYSESPNSFIRPLVMIPPDYFLCNHGHSEQTLELCGAILIPVVPCVLILKSISHKW